MKLHKDLKPGVTYDQNVTDTVHRIPHSKLELNDMRAKYARILVETNNAEYAYGVDPSQDGSAPGYPATSGDIIELHSYAEIQQFRIINDTAASGIDLTITIFYK